MNPNLAVIPVTARFVFEHALRENLRIFSEVTAENHDEGPDIANAIGDEVTGKY